ncbi:MAG: beta-N-acetylhexosaminidase [Planctomycetes bacterium]|nr:beta-N-acetylhexosaminidase [Planctomycetota bacterium]
MHDAPRHSTPLASASALVCIGIAGTSLRPEEAALLAGGVRSVVLFTRNYSDAAQLAHLCMTIREAAGRSVLICVDQEGGRVQRFRGAPFPDQAEARALGALGAEAVALASADTATALRTCGINMNLAPVLDVDSNPNNPVIGNRSFGRDPAIVAELGAACVRAMQRCGVAACGKHFPGHGDTDVDSHLALPSLAHALPRLEQLELVPFRAAIAAKVAAIMTAHVVLEAIDPGVPATLSATVIEGMLRKTLGYDGLILTDDFDMKAIADRFESGAAAVRSIEAGCDLVLACRDIATQRRVIEALSDAIADGRLPKERVARSHRRLEQVLGAYPSLAPDAAARTA